MYCKIFIEVTKAIADVLQGLYRCQKANPADVLQDLYRSHKDNCHKSTNENAVPVTKSSPQDTLCKIVTNIHFTGVFKQFGNKLTFLSYLHVKMG